MYVAIQAYLHNNTIILRLLADTFNPKNVKILTAQCEAYGVMKLQDKTTTEADPEQTYEQVEEELTSSRRGLQVGATQTHKLERSTQQMYEEVLTTRRYNPQVGSTTTTIQHNNMYELDFEVHHGKEEKQVRTHQETETETSQL